MIVYGLCKKRDHINVPSDTGGGHSSCILDPVQVSADSSVSVCSGHCDTSFPCILDLGTGPQQIHIDECDSGSIKI